MAEARPGPLDFLVVGSDISSLTAALGLRQQGHRARVFESSGPPQGTLGPVFITPDSHEFLRKLGVLPKTIGARPVEVLTVLDSEGIVRRSIDLTQIEPGQYPWIVSTRRSLREELEKQSTRTDGVGMPVTLERSRKVISLDAYTTTVTLDDGTIVSGDSVLGDDGINTVPWHLDTGDVIERIGSATSAFAFSTKCDRIQQNHDTKSLEIQGHMIVWTGDDRRLVMYPSSDEEMSVIGSYSSSLSIKSEQDCSNTGRSLADIYEAFGPAVRSLMRLIDVTSLERWTIPGRSGIKRWTKGRMAILGSPSLLMLPDLEVGLYGGDGMEDAAFLVTLFGNGTAKETIYARLALYEQSRDERLQKRLGYSNQASPNKVRSGLGVLDGSHFFNWIFSDNKLNIPNHNLKRHALSGPKSTYLRQPVHFGPSPSPRQNRLGQPIPSHDSKFTTFSIRFETSVSYLEPFFPTSSFSFQSPDTAVQAAWVCTELDNMAWLGGTGYRLCGLWIHGVQYTKGDGSRLCGSLIPILFENLTDPILTGREELGMPKLFCDIDISGMSSETVITCSWRGFEFAKFSFPQPSEDAMHKGDQQEEEAQNSEKVIHSHILKDDGNFIYRYIPAVGQPGLADAEYAVFLETAREKTTRIVETETSFNTRATKIEVVGGDWQRLPTLHHITSVLAGIPIHRVLDARMEKGRGVDDFSHARRIE
ncbi:hypothetical protein S40288_09902 [Stachybotrys chartarum IBT 40288]|nr:hypothetical protein S40288_09902 [Stachybotrys chartarum IBT 40288]